MQSVLETTPDIVVNASQRDDGPNTSRAPNAWISWLACSSQPVRQPHGGFRMVLKRLWHLTLPVFLLVADGSMAEALTSPSALTATAISTSQIRLSWVGVYQGELSYSIERSMSSTSGFTQIGTAGRYATSYTSSGLAPGTRYYYRVRAIKNGTPSAYSSIAGATTFGVVTTTTIFTTTTVTSSTSTTLPTSSGPVANAGADQFTQTLTTLTFN